MPKYFFHVHHDSHHWDEVGEELADKHAAWEEATVMAGRILRGLDGKLRPKHDWVMDVTDEFQNILYRLHLRGKAALTRRGSEVRDRSLPRVQGRPDAICAKLN